MATNLTLASIKSTGGTASRTIGDRLADIINVKDYGAKGNGSTDDTAAVQAAFNAAFGTWSAPNGGTGATLNKKVFFPNGTYLVNPPHGSYAVTNVVDDGSGHCKITVASTGGLVNGDIVYVRGVLGTTFANGSYTISSLTGTTFVLNNSQFNATYTGGGTVSPPALRLRAVRGGLISGAGLLSTVITCGTANCATISTQGMDYSQVENITFQGGAGGISFDLNADGTGGGGVTLQSNNMVNCAFGGTASATTDYGCAIGLGFFMGQSTAFINCNVTGCDVGGIYIANYNALDNIVVGGQFQNCKTAIWVHAGSCPLISGTGFQNYQQAQQFADIYIESGAGEGYVLSALRTESPNFIRTGSDQAFLIEGCNHSNGVGQFFHGSGSVTIVGCQSQNGTIGGNPYLLIENCQFGNANYLTGDVLGHNFRGLVVTPLRITTQSGTSYNFTETDGGAKVQFTSSSAVTATVRKNSDGTLNLQAGASLTVQQTGTGQVTIAAASGVTILSSLGLKLRTQNSVATLTCDGADTWTLNGDTAS